MLAEVEGRQKRPPLGFFGTVRLFRFFQNLNSLPRFSAESFLNRSAPLICNKAFGDHRGSPWVFSARSTYRKQFQNFDTKAQ